MSTVIASRTSVPLFLLDPLIIVYVVSAIPELLETCKSWSADCDSIYTPFHYAYYILSSLTSQNFFVGDSGIWPSRPANRAVEQNCKFVATGQQSPPGSYMQDMLWYIQERHKISWLHSENSAREWRIVRLACNHRSFHCSVAACRGYSQLEPLLEFSTGYSLLI